MQPETKDNTIISIYFPVLSRHHWFLFAVFWCCEILYTVISKNSINIVIEIWIDISHHNFSFNETTFEHIIIVISALSLMLVLGQLLQLSPSNLLKPLMSTYSDICCALTAPLHQQLQDRTGGGRALETAWLIKDTFMAMDLSKPLTSISLWTVVVSQGIPGLYNSHCISQTTCSASVILTIKMVCKYHTGHSCHFIKKNFFNVHNLFGH